MRQPGRVRSGGYSTELFFRFQFHSSYQRIQAFRHFLPVLQYDCDSGTEELAHLEMIGAIVYQLTRDLTPEEIKASGFDTYFVDHTTGIYPVAASGAPFTAAYLQSKGDVITDLHEDLAAEQKARTTYDNILRFCDDPDVIDPIKFLRAREVVHYQRFGEPNIRSGNIKKACNSSIFREYLDIGTNAKSNRHVF